MTACTGGPRWEDTRGRHVLEPVDKLSYIEIGEPETRHVGFGAL